MYMIKLFFKKLSIIFVCVKIITITYIIQKILENYNYICLITYGSYLIPRKSSSYKKGKFRM